MKNAVFMEHVKTVIDGARQFMADPDLKFGFRAYFLLGENQSRIFKMPIEDIMSRDQVPPPEHGRFVAAISGDGLDAGKVVLVFSEFPIGVKISQMKTALAYRPDELIKGSKHLTDWIERSIVPVADGV